MILDIIKGYQKIKKSVRGENLTTLENKVIEQLRPLFIEFHARFALEADQVLLMDNILTVDNIDLIENYLDNIEKLNQHCRIIFEQKIPLDTIDESVSLFHQGKLDLSTLDKIKFINTKLEQLISVHSHRHTFARIHNLDKYFAGDAYIPILFKKVVKSVNIHSLPNSLMNRKTLNDYKPGEEFKIIKSLENYYKKQPHYFSEDELKNKTMLLLHTRIKSYQSIDVLLSTFFPLILLFVFGFFQIVLFNEYIFSNASMNVLTLFLVGLFMANLNLLFFHLLQRERLTSYNNHVIPIVIIVVETIMYGFFITSIEFITGIFKTLLFALTLIPTSIYSFALRGKHHRYYHGIYIFILANILVFLFYRFSLFEIILFIIFSIGSQYFVNNVLKRLI